MTSDSIELLGKLILAFLALFGGKELFNKIIFQRIEKGERIGRDKVVNNYYNVSRVGDPDLLLSESSVPSREPVSGDDGDLVPGALKILADADGSIILVSSDIEKVIDFFERVFKENGNWRNGHCLIMGALFALISQRHRNLEWQEHCASSLRELFHQWKGSEGLIVSAFTKIRPKGANNFPTAKNGRDLYARMRWYYEFFSSICHHHHPDALVALKSIRDDREIKDISDDLFNKTVAMFFYEMVGFIRLTGV
ncbi:MAG: hypothetical protein AAB473_00235 [Patescibacteria group bacterium]